MLSAIERQVIHIRDITRDEAGLFAGFSDNAERTKAVLIELWDECRSCPEWCFVAEEDGHVLARIGFWILPSIVTTFHIGWLALSWTGDYLGVGTELWREVIKRIRNYGATNVESALDSDAEFVDQRRRFYEQVDLPLLQEKWEYVWKECTALPPLGDRLQFRTLAEVGEAAFLEAIQRVTQSTLDREDQYVLRTENPVEAAQRYFGVLKDIDYTPGRWFLAYCRMPISPLPSIVPRPSSPTPPLIGLVAPQMLNDEVGAINYIGVLPEHRGKGYVNDLLAKGTSVLREAGARQVIASIDFLNHPVLAAAERAGFKRDISSRIYRLDLP